VGEERIEEIDCDTDANTCRVSVPAPGAALIFFSEPAVRESQLSATMTFATTAVTKLQNTATVAAEVLETSNGHSGRDRVNAQGETRWGSTSRGSASGARGRGEEGIMSGVWKNVARTGGSGSNAMIMLLTGMLTVWGWTIIA
jgi:hypothetical protein